MDISEKELEDMIWRTASTNDGVKFLNDRGLHLKGTLLRQVNLGNFGVADMVTIYFVKHKPENRDPYWTCFVNVYELKKDEIGLDAYGQAVRYQEGLEYFLMQNLNCNLAFHIHLIGRKIVQAGDFLAIARTSYDLSLYEYDFGVDGLHFRAYRPHDFRMQNPGNPPNRLFSLFTLKAILKRQLRF